MPSSKDDISKEIPPKAGRGLIFKGLRPEAEAEYHVINWERLFQTLKNKTTGNEPYRYRFEKTGMTGV